MPGRIPTAAVVTCGAAVAGALEYLHDSLGSRTTAQSAAAPQSAVPTDGEPDQQQPRHGVVQALRRVVQSYPASRELARRRTDAGADMHLASMDQGQAGTGVHDPEAAAVELLVHNLPHDAAFMLASEPNPQPSTWFSRHAPSRQSSRLRIQLASINQGIPCSQDQGAEDDWFSPGWWAPHGPAPRRSFDQRRSTDQRRSFEQAGDHHTAATRNAPPAREVLSSESAGLADLVAAESASAEPTRAAMKRVASTPAILAAMVKPASASSQRHSTQRPAAHRPGGLADLVEVAVAPDCESLCESSTVAAVCVQALATNPEPASAAAAAEPALATPAKPAAPVAAVPAAATACSGPVDAPMAESGTTVDLTVVPASRDCPPATATSGTSGSGHGISTTLAAVAAGGALLLAAPAVLAVGSSAAAAAAATAAAAAAAPVAGGAATAAGTAVAATFLPSMGAAATAAAAAVSSGWSMLGSWRAGSNAEPAGSNAQPAGSNAEPAGSNGESAGSNAEPAGSNAQPAATYCPTAEEECMRPLGTLDIQPAATVCPTLEEQYTPSATHVPVQSTCTSTPLLAEQPMPSVTQASAELTAAASLAEEQCTPPAAETPVQQAAVTSQCENVADVQAPAVVAAQSAVLQDSYQASLPTQDLAYGQQRLEQPTGEAHHEQLLQLQQQEQAQQPQLLQQEQAQQPQLLQQEQEQQPQLPQQEQEQPAQPQPQQEQVVQLQLQQAASQELQAVQPQQLQGQAFQPQQLQVVQPQPEQACQPELEHAVPQQQLEQAATPLQEWEQARQPQVQEQERAEPQQQQAVQPQQEPAQPPQLQAQQQEQAMQPQLQQQPQEQQAQLQQQEQAAQPNEQALQQQQHQAQPLQQQQQQQQQVHLPKLPEKEMTSIAPVTQSVPQCTRPCEAAGTTHMSSSAPIQTSNTAPMCTQHASDKCSSCSAGPAGTTSYAPSLSPCSSMPLSCTSNQTAPASLSSHPPSPHCSFSGANSSHHNNSTSLGSHIMQATSSQLTSEMSEGPCSQLDSSVCTDLSDNSCSQLSGLGDMATQEATPAAEWQRQAQQHPTGATSATHQPLPAGAAVGEPQRQLQPAAASRVAASHSALPAWAQLVLAVGQPAHSGIFSSRTLPDHIVALAELATLDSAQPGARSSKMADYIPAGEELWQGGNPLSKLLKVHALPDALLAQLLPLLDQQQSAQLQQLPAGSATTATPCLPSHAAATPFTCTIRSKPSSATAQMEKGDEAGSCELTGLTPLPAGSKLRAFQLPDCVLAQLESYRERAPASQSMRAFALPDCVLVELVDWLTEEAEKAQPDRAGDQAQQQGVGLCEEQQGQAQRSGVQAFGIDFEAFEEDEGEMLGQWQAGSTSRLSIDSSVRLSIDGIGPLPVRVPSVWHDGSSDSQPVPTLARTSLPTLATSPTSVGNTAWNGGASSMPGTTKATPPTRWSGVNRNLSMPLRWNTAAYPESADGTPMTRATLSPLPTACEIQAMNVNTLQTARQHLKPITTALSLRSQRSGGLTAIAAGPESLPASPSLPPTFPRALSYKAGMRELLGADASAFPRAQSHRAGMREALGGVDSGADSGSPCGGCGSSPTSPLSSDGFPGDAYLPLPPDPSEHVMALLGQDKAWQQLALPMAEWAPQVPGPAGAPTPAGAGALESGGRTTVFHLVPPVVGQPWQCGPTTTNHSITTDGSTWQFESQQHDGVDHVICLGSLWEGRTMHQQHHPLARVLAVNTGGRQSVLVELPSTCAGARFMLLPAGTLSEPLQTTNPCPDSCSLPVTPPCTNQSELLASRSTYVDVRMPTSRTLRGKRNNVTHVVHMPSQTRAQSGLRAGALSGLPGASPAASTCCVVNTNSKGVTWVKVTLEAHSAMLLVVMQGQDKQQQHRGLRRQGSGTTLTGMQSDVKAHASLQGQQTEERGKEGSAAPQLPNARMPCEQRRQRRGRLNSLCLAPNQIRELVAHFESHAMPPVAEQPSRTTATAGPQRASSQPAQQIDNGAGLTVQESMNSLDSTLWGDVQQFTELGMKHRTGSGSLHSGSEDGGRGRMVAGSASQRMSDSSAGATSKRWRP